MSEKDEGPEFPCFVCGAESPPQNHRGGEVDPRDYCNQHVPASSVGDGALGQKTRKLGDEPVVDVPRGARVRIRTAEMVRRPSGRDTFVHLVLEDGREVPIPNVLALKVAVDSRSDYVSATLVLHGVELEVDATANVDFGQSEIQDKDYWRRFALRSVAKNVALRSRLSVLDPQFGEDDDG